MNEPPAYRLRWRGQITGPHAETDIDQKLDDHEIGLCHEIEQEGIWISVEDFLERRARARTAALPPSHGQQLSHLPNTLGESTTRNFSQEPVNGLLPQATCGAGSAQEPVNGPAERPKSMKIFLILGLLLGFAGAHNFYAGYWGMALVQLALSCLTWWLGLGIFLPWIWAWLELFIVHTDHRGIRMT